MRQNSKVNRRDFLKIAFAASTTCLFDSAVRPLIGAESKPKPPNIVVLLADDLGYKDIGCYGGPVKTPTLDALAANGMRFTDFYSGAAVCSPSRATLLTGRQHIRAGVYSWIHDYAQNSHLARQEVTLAGMLRKQGYVCRTHWSEN